jgi:hypothetical protein
MLIAALIGLQSLIAQETVQIAEQPAIAETNRSFWTTQHMHVARRFKTMRQSIQLPKKIDVKKIGKNVGIVAGALVLAVSAALGLPYAYKRILAMISSNNTQQPEPTTPNLPQNNAEMQNSDPMAKNNSAVNAMLLSDDPQEGKPEDIFTPFTTEVVNVQVKDMPQIEEQKLQNTLEGEFPPIDVNQLPRPIFIDGEDQSSTGQSTPESSNPFAQQLLSKKNQVSKRDWSRGTVRGDYALKKAKELEEKKKQEGRPGISAQMLQQQKQKKNIQYTVTASKLNDLAKTYTLSQDTPQFNEETQRTLENAQRMEHERKEQQSTESTTTDEEWNDDTNVNTAYISAAEKAQMDQVARLQEQKKKEVADEAKKYNSGSIKKELTEEQQKKIEEDRQKAMEEQAAFLQQMRSKVREGDPTGTYAPQGGSRGRSKNQRIHVGNVFNQ